MSTERTTGKRPTSYDVAKYAGVSQTTVSLVLSGKGNQLGISPETQANVVQAAKTLAYYPNSLIKSIQSKRTGIVGFYAENHGWGSKNSYWIDLLSSLHSVIVEKDLELLIYGDAPGRTAEKVLERMLGGILDGIIVQPGGDGEVMSALVRSPIPMVCMGGVHSDIPSVTIDYIGGMRQLVDHLYEKGYRNLALLNGAAAERGGVVLRREGFVARASELGVLASQDCVVTTQYGVTAGLERILSLIPRIDALICFNDDMGYSAIEYFEKKGLRVPQDIAVAGFDGIAFPHAHHQLTTASWSRTFMCETTVDILLKDIRGEKPALVITMPTELSVGETT